MDECDKCAVENNDRHELWCSRGPQTLTLGELREVLDQAIEIDGVHESKRVGLWDSESMRLLPLKSLSVQFVRGEFVLVLAEQKNLPTGPTTIDGIMVQNVDFEDYIRPCMNPAPHEHHRRDIPHHDAVCPGVKRHQG